MRSLRFQLIFWNTLMLALALLAVGGTIAWLNLSRLSAGIDRELADRARNFGRVPPGGLSPGPGSPRTPQGQRPPATNIQFQLPRQDPQGQGMQPPPFPDAESALIGSIRRPRLVDAEGKQVGRPDDVLFDPQAIARARTSGSIYSTVRFSGEQLRVYTVSAPRFGDGFVVQVAREMRDYNELARVQWMTLATVMPFALLFAIGGGLFLTGRAMRPIAAMGESARRIGSGQFGERVPDFGGDELGELGRALNEMAGRLGMSFEEQREAYDRLERSYDQQRRFVADASHELRTPLARLQLTTSAALSGGDADQKEALKVADVSAQTMGKLVTQLLDLAQADAGELKPQKTTVDLRALVADTVAGLPGTPPVQVDLPETAVLVQVDPAQISRVVSNLVENSRRHTSPDGRVTVRVKPRSIEVEDTGSGIAAEDLANVTKRFFRVDAARSREQGGTGLGLSIVDEIVRAHGGTLSIESELGKGTRVRIEFPGEDSSNSK